MSPFLDLSRADNDQVEGHTEPAQLAPQPRRLSTPVRNVTRLDHQQIEIGVGAALSARARAKKDDLRAGRSCGEPAPGLLDQGFF